MAASAEGPGRWIAPHESLLALVVAAAVLGVAAPAAARAVRPAVPLMLAGQVLGVALTVTAGEILPVARRPARLVAALAVQWTVMPAVGYGLYLLAGGGLAGQGALVTAVSPAEITSALVALLAGGEGATAAALMAASVAVGCVLTPVWLLPIEHAGAAVGGASLVSELALSVAMPLAVGVAVRTRVAAVARHRRRCLDLAALSLVAVVFVGAGDARPLLLSGRVTAAVALAVVLVVAGAALGFAVARASRAPRRVAVALAFPVGMREFGIATAVALAVVPAAAGFGGLYGAILMLSATAAARLARRSGRGSPNAPG